MKQLNNCLSEIKYGYVSTVVKSAAKTLTLNHEVSKAWPKIMGNLESVLHFSYCRNKKIIIESENPSWKTEISFFEKKIIQKLHQYVRRSRNISGIKLIVTYTKKKQSNGQVKARNIEKKTLAEKIKFKNRRMKDMGYVWCMLCQSSWTMQDRLCVFCRNKKEYR
ncbi:MAG: DciA family protein [bacterium]